jgi:hypothetical protein
MSGMDQPSGVFKRPSLMNVGICYSYFLSPLIEYYAKKKYNKLFALDKFTLRL